MSEFIIAKALKYLQPKEEKIINSETIPWSMVAKGLPITLILMASYCSYLESQHGRATCTASTDQVYKQLTEYCQDHQFTVRRPPHRHNIYGNDPALGPLMEHEGDEKVELNYLWAIGIILLWGAPVIALPYLCWRYYEGSAYSRPLSEWRHADLEAETYYGESEDDNKKTEMTKRVNGMLNFVARYDYPGCRAAQVMLSCMALTIICSALYFMVINNIFDGVLWDQIAKMGANDAWQIIFPVQSKCTYHYFGPSGTRMDLDALCYITNMRFYSITFRIITFAILLLNSLLALNILSLIAVLSNLDLRVWYLNVHIISRKQGQPTKKALKYICQNINWSTFLLLKTLAEHVDPVTMKTFLIAFHETLIPSSYMQNEENDDLSLV